MYFNTTDTNLLTTNNVNIIDVQSDCTNVHHTPSLYCLQDNDILNTQLVDRDMPKSVLHIRDFAASELNKDGFTARILGFLTIHTILCYAILFLNMDPITSET